MGELAESASRISPHIPNRQPLGSPKSSIVPFDLFKEKYIIEKKENDLLRRKSSKLFTPQSDGSCSETRGWNDLF